MNANTAVGKLNFPTMEGDVYECEYSGDTIRFVYRPVLGLLYGQGVLLLCLCEILVIKPNSKTDFCHIECNVCVCVSHAYVHHFVCVSRIFVSHCVRCDRGLLYD